MKLKIIYFNILNNFPRYKKMYCLYLISMIHLYFTDPAKVLNNDPRISNTHNYMIFPAIKQMVDVAKLCKKLGYYIIIITARPYESEKSSIKNLEYLGIKYDEIYHNKFYPDTSFKVNLKNQLAKNII